jgi:hypothetical protein
MAGFSDYHSFNFWFPCVPWLTVREVALFRRVIQSNLNSAAPQWHQHSGQKSLLKWRHTVLLNMWAVHIGAHVPFLGINLFIPITPPLLLVKTRMALVSFRMNTSKMSGLPILFYIFCDYSRDFQRWTCRMTYQIAKCTFLTTAWTEFHVKPSVN